jgi:hypothetical protein
MSIQLLAAYGFGDLRERSETVEERGDTMDSAQRLFLTHRYQALSPRTRACSMYACCVVSSLRM